MVAASVQQQVGAGRAIVLNAYSKTPYRVIVWATHTTTGRRQEFDILIEAGQPCRKQFEAAIAKYFGTAWAEWAIGPQDWQEPIEPF